MSEPSARLAALRGHASRRRRTMPNFPDSPEEVAERVREQDAWWLMQVEGLALQEVGGGG